MQMLFPFCKPFKLWLVRSAAVQQRNCTSLFCTSATALSHRGGWQGVQHHSTGQPRLWGDWLVFRLVDHVWLQRLTQLKDGDLGILIRPSTDFNQQRSDEMTAALIIAQVTAAHYESQFQLFKATSYSPLPHVQIPEVFLFWLPRILAFCLFVCWARCKHDFLEAVSAMSFTELKDISLISATAAWQYCLLLNLKIKCWCLSFRHHNSIPTLILLLLKCNLH